MSAEHTLVVDGAVEHARSFSFDDLAALDEAYQIADVSPLHPGRKGHAVDLRGLLQVVRPRAEADYLTLHAERDDFHVSIPLADIFERGMILYRIGDAPLSTSQGGPIRFLIRDSATCHSAELDDCANVKYLSRIELTIKRGRDTRPENETSHAALHEHQQQQAQQ